MLIIGEKKLLNSFMWLLSVSSCIVIVMKIGALSFYYVIVMKIDASFMRLGCLKLLVFFCDLKKNS